MNIAGLHAWLGRGTADQAAPKKKMVPFCLVGDSITETRTGELVRSYDPRPLSDVLLIDSTGAWDW